MVQLYGISNAGFSFTHTYLLDIINLKKCVYINKGRQDITYADLQEQVGNPSRVRMIVPFLKKIGIISENAFIGKDQLVDFEKFFSKKAKPFIKFLDVYSDPDVEYDNAYVMSKLRDIMHDIMSLYLKDLCKIIEYRTILKYLLIFNTLNKYEFFFITTFEFNDVDDIMGYKNAGDLILFYRNNNNIENDFEFSNNVNCYSYVMQILCDFNVCRKKDSYFEVINREIINDAIGG